MAGTDDTTKYVDIPLTGRWRPAVDGTELGEGDFQTLTNLRYGDVTPKSVTGMTKYNTAVIDVTYLTPRAGHHFRKSIPAESHVLVQAFDAGGTNSAVFENSTAVGSQGNFVTLFSETSGASDGCFTDAPDGAVVFTNGLDTAVYGGNFFRCSGFVVSESTDVTKKDYTTVINNTLTDTNNVATLANNSYVYIGSTRPLSGIKWDVGTVNAAAATVAINYWASNGTWTSVGAIVDTTTTGGATLAKDGNMIFSTTVTTAKPKLINKVYLYWYQVIFTGNIAGTTIVQCQLQAPVQQMVDIWDGMERSVASCLFWNNTSSKYKENTTNVFKEDYLSTNTLTYMPLGTMGTNDYIMIGFEERMTAIGVILATDQENTSAATMTVSYWNGSAWASVTGLSDGTLQSTTDTFGQSGVIHWLAPSEISEFKTSVVNKEQYYYYKIAVSGALSDTKVDYIYGIPAQKTIRPHLYCTNWQNRVVLVNEYSNRKNSILISTKDSVCAFNGVDSTMLTFGNDDPVLCAEPIFSRFGGSTYDNLIVFKQSETWLVDGTSPEDYTLYKIADNYGCVARGTLKSCSTGYEVSPGLLKHVLIWQSASAICLFDGNSIVDISADIKNYFDPNKTEGIGSATVGNSKAFYDEHNDEYHWLFESGGESTPMNTELVYNVVKKKWYKLDRGTGKYLQIGFGARDTYGNFYTYGGIDTGYIEKLESGTTFDGTNITSTFKTADIAFGGWSNQSRIRRVKHLCIAKVTTTNTVTMTHFNDTETTATDTVTFSVNATGKRVAKVNKSVNWNEDAVFHSFNCVLITSDENVGYEPIGLNVGVRILREDIL